MNEGQILQQEMICALATASGVGAIAVIRLSGEGSIALVNGVFKGADLERAASHTVHFGTLRNEDTLIDEVLVSVFRTPRSFTKEDSIEISCHGSDYIVRQILKLLIQKGARIARPGEFTQRAFLNGQFDLVQAEAVADLIAADSEASHKTALNQLRGGFSKKLGALRTELIHFASLIELELDFGEEDVEFAEREDLRRLINALLNTINPLIDSFDFGNAIKEGFPVAIIGSPNVGKSTLLNALLNEEKAIVTSIAGTTRDVIEDTIVLGGLKFRFIDTAGIRETTDEVETIGIARSKQAMEKADIVVFLFDDEQTLQELHPLSAALDPGKKRLWVRNKVDVNATEITRIDGSPVLAISAKGQQGLEALKDELIRQVKTQSASDTVVSNARHYEHLLKTRDALHDVVTGLDTGITGDFLAQDIRLSLHHLGEITGTIVTDDLLDNIFSKFCIGK
ncbi:tRNA uridine-5-carboxymethylaminomethyl(34) synthesis GTPase MnmE [Dyadobacter tibetensis]|uniref:tRNA uridine-5-carboxymethylaminomethyl(34) synthesis GTPase MnmE n=1 Tax=Dyadobacter tibetensis TaxID=1211851 RepID=UPI0004B5263D|nr:tRNA uridine-5-carboxymethylaminomethyl(34) synthesis GTPase MnmE [Dyadobacter tibetensis]